MNWEELVTYLTAPFENQEAAAWWATLLILLSLTYLLVRQYPTKKD